MGNAISIIRHAFTELFDNVRTFQTLQRRIDTEPGLPVENPTRSFWMYPPSPIARHCSDLPQYADVVVIGSGITGTSVARTLLDRVHAEGKQLPVLLMLEARDACSGATGRNGGHITPSLYQDFAILRQDHGDAAAHKIIKFRLAHLHELRRAAEEEGVFEQSQWRQVETVDAFFNRDLFAKAKAQVQAYQQALPSEASYYRVYESPEAIEKYDFASDVVGSIASGAGALHPYNFVTGILSNLLKRYPDNFFLCTNTPCTSIAGPETSDPGLYTIITSKGSVKTPHVIHATNAWSSQLLTPMRGKIIPFLGNMTAQRPGQSIPPETLQRSFIFYEIPVGYDYLTRLPNGGREFILGGGFAQEGDEGYAAVANTDDSAYIKRVGAHLGGILPRYFGEDNWGREGQPSSEEDTSVEWAKGRVKATWSGVLGILRICSHEASIPTAPGEWIAAGYTGEGMVQAWMSGKALAEMVLGREREGNLAEWFPDILRVSTARWKKAKPEALLDFMSRD
ncbi:FAD dependent oxidoreductase [Boletus reticuloceps]|uniref:FAD dependent oxidoreductase n=1 Tax=Boletus reticuloceps TaxID=495285 RepID=A0A8I2YM86_9AGAM|nr:FAD dependent oxidoreductase [Boletus reticuloceps]